ncbi:MAG: nodulation protein NodH [Pseudomonadota bacterium]
MARPFDFFVVLADMRTGSNFLEASLNQLSDVTCYGEVFNPVFIGSHNRTELFEIDMGARERDPFQLIERMVVQTDGLSGFRLFHDHDPRVLDFCLQNRRCAKIVLSRNPVESFVSLQIAIATGQWKLRDVAKRKTKKIRFDQTQYAAFLNERQNFQTTTRRSLQRSGQTAFVLDYSDLNDVGILNGLARFIGSEDQLKAPSKATKRQNPVSMADKVINHQEMLAVVQGQTLGAEAVMADPEPKRGPGVPGFCVMENPDVIFAPIAAGPTRAVRDLMSSRGHPIATGLTQGELRKWKRSHVGHRSFTVLRHPVPRAYGAFRAAILSEASAHEMFRAKLADRYGVQVAGDADKPEIARAFARFLEFLKLNLAGETSLKVDPIWSTQSELLDGIATVMVPDTILREADTLAPVLYHITGADPRLPRPVWYDELRDIYSAKIEKLCKAAYRKDYITFGFGDWDQAA